VAAAVEYKGVVVVLRRGEDEGDQLKKGENEGNRWEAAKDDS
jgi:hypothetical protein